MKAMRCVLMLGGLIGLALATTAEAMEPVSLTELMRRLALSEYTSGARPPEFVSCCHRGETVSLAGLRGKVVLLTFWATWCTECREEMPAFERLHRELAPDGLSVLGMNVRERPERIERYARGLGLTFPLLSDRHGTIRAAYGVVGVPTTFLIDRGGRPVALAIGRRNWESPAAHEILRRLLAKHEEASLGAQ